MCYFSPDLAYHSPLSLHYFLAILTLCLSIAGCRKADYPQDTPQATIASARKMVESGDAERLHTLVYAEGEEMRGFLKRTSRLLGDLEELGLSIQRKFPEETAKLRASAQEAAAKGKATSLIGQVTSSMRGGNRRQGPPKGDERKAFDDAALRLFADPYAFLRESEGKLDAVPLNDDMMAVTWNGKPVLQPIGLAMRQDEKGNWCFVLPLEAPGLDRFMPKTKEQFDIFGKLVMVLDKTVVDLRKEVESGRLGSLEAVSRRAGEMTFMPAVLVMYSYVKYSESIKPASGGS